MSRNQKRNMGHSVFERLLNRARANREDFNLLLSRYGNERFLYRLSISPHCGRFILKGASLFLVWKGRNYRVTRDVDLLGSVDPDPAHIAGIFREIFLIQCPRDDGMIYLPESLHAQKIREEQAYDGVRMTFVGLLNQARIPMQIDIGFGDAVTPPPEFVAYPTLFDGPAPRLQAYPRYALIAEKVEAMVKLGLANSRMKDFFDMWLLAHLFAFEGRTLGEAMMNTFRRRRTPLPDKVPSAFTSEFYEDRQKQLQWKAFIRKTRPDVPMAALPSVIADVYRFIMPVIEALQTGICFDSVWYPDQGWRRIPGE